MNQESFSKRADAAENAFFADVDAKLLDKLRASFEKEQSIDKVSALTGIRDKELLKAIVDAGVDGSTITAMHVFPMVAVAWADNVIQAQERERLMDAARSRGMTPETPAGMLLAAWLAHKPGEGVFRAWEGFARSLIQSLDEEENAEKVRRGVEKN